MFNGNHTEVHEVISGSDGSGSTPNLGFRVLKVLLNVNKFLPFFNIPQHIYLVQIVLNPFFFIIFGYPTHHYFIRGEMYWKWKSTEWMSTWCHQLLSRKRISRGGSCVLCRYSSWLGTRSLCIDVLCVSWRQTPVLFAGSILKFY